MVKFESKNVEGGWQTALMYGEVEVRFGPVFNSISNLWRWQTEHLPGSKP